MAATIREIVDEAQRAVGEVAGVGVQMYSDDRMFEETIRGFNLIFKKRAWEQYSDWTTVVLDGATGIITTDSFENVIDLDDFISVNRAGYTDSLPRKPIMTNPNSLGSGTTPKCFSLLPTTHANYVKRKLIIYPVTSTGSLDVLARRYPIVAPATDWDWEDPKMYFDKDLLVYATAYMTLSGDDLNPGAADSMKEMMEMRYKDITAGIARHGIPIEGRTGVPDEWYTRP